MDWLAANWIWLVLGAGVLAFFAFGGGCGMGHRRHGHRRDGEIEGKSQPGAQPSASATEGHSAPRPGSGAHRHGC